MDQFIQAKEGLEPVWQEIQEGKQTVSLEGISGSGKAFFLALLFRRTSRSILVLTPDSTSAREFYEDLAFFLNPPLKKRGSAHGTGKELTLLEATAVYVKEAYFFHEIPFPIGPSLEAIGNRLDTLEQLLSCRKILTVSSTAAVLRRVLPRKVLAKTTTLLEVKGLQELGELEEIAIERGYRRVDEVEDRGEFAVRGGIFDIYTPGYANPLRIELNDDEIESIREFDLASQKSIRLLEKARLLPIREFFSDSGKERETIFDYLPDDGLIVLDDVSSIYQQVRRLWDLAQEDRRCSSDPPAPAQQAFNGKPTGNTASLYLDTEEIQLYLEEFQTLHLFPLGPTKEEEEEKIHSLTAEPVGHYQGRFADLARQLLQWQREKYNITLACLSRGQSVRLKSLLEEYGVSSTSASDSIPIRLIEKTFLPWTDTHDVSTNSGPFPIRILIGRLSAGFRLPDLKVAVLVEDEIFGLRRRLPPTRQPRRDLFLSNFANLKANDYVVHVDHGIGHYLGIAKLETGGNWREFLEIEYTGGDKLYVPLDRLNLVQRYIGSNSTPPPLGRLGHSAWKKMKDKVKHSLRDVARELLRLYAARQISSGNAFSSDNHWHQEFDAFFEYEETPHQLQAIQDVKADLEKPKPMDRLVCGDVGYGKTEVAMRAAFKSVMDSKQVAVLVPTTILAQQHLQTFHRRFAHYPIRIEALSRFKSRQEQRGIIRGLKEGSVQIVIGTHRLLQKDIQFRELGLLVIDEEQRFGVNHKEKLKQLRKDVDVLALTATPIPRTLHLSLAGIRDISIIETPPEDRLPIQTYVRGFSNGVIREAILRELERGGQVFFVHNRVGNIEVMGEYLQQLIPQAKIGIAHGQVQERELEEIMVRFLGREFDILLSTTIIESGLDIPSVNTIIINRADHLGLAQLYQLRGRVGRDRYQAYAYLLIPGEDITSEKAKKRLQAVKELSALGSSFQLASRDMEIRGAGNMLGHQQSGQQMSAVGFELYCNLLEESVRELKGEFFDGEEIEPEVLLEQEGYIPEEFIVNSNQRLDICKRLSDIKAPEDFRCIQEELEDRYGALPNALEIFLCLLEIKALARKLRIMKLEREKETVFLYFSPHVTLIPFERFEEEKENLTLMKEHVLCLKLEEDNILEQVKTALMGLMKYITI